MNSNQLRQREPAEELAQEVLLRAYLKLDTLDRPEFFPVWVHRIARNLANDWFRSGNRHSELLQMVPLDEAHGEHVRDQQAPSPREQVAQAQEQERLREAVLRLPDSLREIVLLHLAENLTNAEIARRVGLDRASVGRRMEKALTILRREFGRDVTELGRKAVRPSSRSVANASALVIAAAALTGPAQAALLAAAASTPAASSVIGSALAKLTFSGVPRLSSPSRRLASS